MIAILRSQGYIHRDITGQQIDLYLQMKLNKAQKKALGILKQEEIQQFVWNPKLATIYAPIDQANFEFEQCEQTFLEFLQMEDRQPNEQGTGRFKLSYFDRIQVTFITKKNSKAPPRKVKDTICNYLSSFLRMKCHFNPRIKLQIDNKNFILDKQSGIFYKTKSIKQSIDVHDLLSVMNEYKNQKTILVAFIESQLNEDGIEVDGRASGNGVASISYYAKGLEQNLAFYCQTSLHETLHTLGFDHCQIWECLMNSFTNSQSWFCPLCSRKLYHELAINSAEGAIQWMKEAIVLLSQLKVREAIRKGQMIIRYIS